jgi:hypothetical protein
VPRAILAGQRLQAADQSSKRQPRQGDVGRGGAGDRSTILRIIPATLFRTRVAHSQHLALRRRSYGSENGQLHAQLVALLRKFGGGSIGINGVLERNTQRRVGLAG